MIKKLFIFCTMILMLQSISCADNKGESVKMKESEMENLAKAVFAGGCFWCMEPPFEKIDGVYAVISGYTGGERKNPSYQQVASGQTAHREAVEVSYDASKVNYEQLLDVFWRNIDPTQEDGQFADIGLQYTTAIFYQDDHQKELAQKSKDALEKSKKFSKPIATKILPAKEFYPAEEYHQDYYKKSPIHYKSYKYGSGRQGFIEKNWGKN